MEIGGEIFSEQKNIIGEFLRVLKCSKTLKLLRKGKMISFLSFKSQRK
jgi:hypothetical protein